jgi:hypothetical protein
MAVVIGRRAPGHASTDPKLSHEPTSLLKAIEHGDSASQDREPVSTLYG